MTVLWQQFVDIDLIKNNKKTRLYFAKRGVTCHLFRPPGFALEISHVQTLNDRW